MSSTNRDLGPKTESAPPDRRQALGSALALGAAALLPAATARAQGPAEATEEQPDATEQALLALSRDKWLWMADRDVAALDKLFHEQAVFVHMGGTMTKSQELGTIEGGGIHYKQADIQEASARLIGDTAVVMNRIRLLAVVGGNEVTNPFMVTEVYVKNDDAWQLAVLAFTRLMGQ